MRIGLLSDIHGNALALAECLRALESLGVDQIYFLGDAVGYLPGEDKVLELLRSAGVICQKGNHEGMLLGELPLPQSRDKVYHLRAARLRLSSSDMEFIASWPEHRTVRIDGRRLLLVHGSPDNHLEGYVYADSNLSCFAGFQCDAVFMGHTHRPFILCYQGKLVVNVGSCGLPRDQGNLSAFAVYDGEENQCEVFRLHFDRDKLVGILRVNDIDDSVHQCLFRKALTPPFGRLLEEVKG